MNRTGPVALADVVHVVAEFARADGDQVIGSPVAVARGGRHLFNTLLSETDIWRLVDDGLATSDAWFVQTQDEDQGVRALPRRGRTYGRSVVRGALLDGYTMLVVAIDSLVPPVGVFRRELEVKLGARVGINAYFTPPSPAGPCQGFPWHDDAHDVIALQAAGRKTWELGGDAASGGRVLLGEGDMLYVPRGVVHRTFGGDVPSLHLSVGLATM
ncbi:MAG TPA: cupin domain-containing protein [Acidimicrobiales bacterium]